MASKGKRVKLALAVVALSYTGGFAVLLMAITGIGNPYSTGDNMDMAANVDHDRFASSAMYYAAYATAALNTLAIALGAMGVKLRDPIPTKFWARPGTPIGFGFLGYVGSVLLFYFAIAAALAYA
jgi:hypothetical protein